MYHHELSYWIYLNKSQLFRSKTALQILKQHTLSELFLLPQYELLALGLNEKQSHWIRQFNQDIIAADLNWLEQENHHIVCLSDDHYPSLLQEIHPSPLTLYIKGNPAYLNQSQLAIVGSRKPTPSGEKTARLFGQILAANNLVITSGLAYGIDAACHQGALLAGNTVAVLACGLDQIYPAKHQKLAIEIIEKGAIVSEFAISTPPQRENFPLRNRIISGLALGVLVVEAALESGSLITAKLALEQNREVFAIPGSIFNQMSQGCHYLIREGATLVTNPTDILQSLAMGAMTFEHLFREKNAENVALDPEHYTILQKIGYEVTNTELILADSTLSLEKINSILLNLELQSLIKSVPGGYCRA